MGQGRGAGGDEGVKVVAFYSSRMGCSFIAYEWGETQVRLKSTVEALEKKNSVLADMRLQLSAASRHAEKQADNPPQPHKAHRGMHAKNPELEDMEKQEQQLLLHRRIQELMETVRGKDQRIRELEVRMM